DRAPTAAVAVHEDDMVELIDRLEAHHERWVTVLLENHCRGERRLDAVRRAVPDHAAKRSQRGWLGRRLRVVGQRVEKVLDPGGRCAAADDALFGCSEAKWYRK